MATLGVSALAIEIGNGWAQLIGLGDTAPLATLFAINPHHAALDSEHKGDIISTNHCLLIQLCQSPD